MTSVTRVKRQYRLLPGYTVDFPSPWHARPWSRCTGQLIDASQVRVQCSLKGDVRSPENLHYKITTTQLPSILNYRALGLFGLV